MADLDDIADCCATYTGSMRLDIAHQGEAIRYSTAMTANGLRGMRAWPSRHSTIMRSAIPITSHTSGSLVSRKTKE